MTATVTIPAEGEDEKQSRLERFAEQGPAHLDAYWAAHPEKRRGSDGGRPVGYREKKSTRLKQRRSKVDRSYESLAKAVRGRVASKQVELDWVQQNMSLPLSALDVAQIPSSGAVAMLKWVKEEGGAKDFFMGLFKSQLPTRKELDAQAALADDGRECVRLIEKLQRLRGEKRKEVAVESQQRGDRHDDGGFDAEGPALA